MRTYDIERYLNIRSAYGASFSADGERLSFLMDTTGVPQVWTVDSPGAWPEQRTFYEERVTFASWSPERPELAFGMDNGGNERAQLFRLEPDTGVIENLTEHPDAKHRWGGWSHDGERFAFTSNRRDHAVFDVYVQARDGTGTDTELVHEGDGWLTVGGFSPDDSKLIVQEAYSNFDQDVSVLDLATGELTHLTPHQGTVRFQSPEWGPDGENVYMVTDCGSDTLELVRYELASGEFTTVETGGDHELDGLSIDHAERWTLAATAGIPRDTFVPPELVRYPTFDGRDIPAFFTLPEESSEGETPVIVDIHGGPESQRRPSFSAVKQYFLSRGYAYFEPNVRGSAGYGKAYGHLDDVEKRMDSVADIEAAVEWLHDHPAVDPDKIVAMGGSYGGFMVLAAMTEYPDLWAAGVDIVGIANFVTFLENTGDWRRELREAEYGSLEDDREFLESISPINNVETIRAPLFVLHGENDPRVPVSEAHQLVEEAREHAHVRELIFDDEGHGFTKLENRIEAYSQIADFLDEYVRSAPAADD